MTLEEFVNSIVPLGYTLSGKIDGMENALVVRAPVVLIPAEPPVQSDCVMVPDVLTWDRFRRAGWNSVAQFARIESAATIKNGSTFAIVHLQFVAAAS